VHDERSGQRARRNGGIADVRARPAQSTGRAVIELFDSAAGRFRPEDQQLVRVAAELGTELLRQALGQRQMQQMLLDAIQAALGASAQITDSMPRDSAERLEQPPPQQVLEQLKAGLSGPTGDDQAAEVNLRLAEAIRVLGLRHGQAALEHCAALVESLRGLLDRLNDR